MCCLPEAREEEGANHVDLTRNTHMGGRRCRVAAQSDYRPSEESPGEQSHTGFMKQPQTPLQCEDPGENRRQTSSAQQRKAMAEGGCAKTEEEEEQSTEEDSQSYHGVGVCKWFNVRMGFGFLSMNIREGEPLEAPVDVFVHQSKLHMEGFRSLKEGEAVEFSFKKSSKGLESVLVTGPGGTHCVGSEKRPKGKSTQKRRSKGDRCYNCGGLDHHAKECKLPPQPKKCHFCQSITHMVASCPIKAQQSLPASQGKPSSLKGEQEEQSHILAPTETID